MMSVLKKKEKNTKNKAKHAKLMAQKEQRLKQEKALRKQRLKAIITGANKKD